MKSVFYTLPVVLIVGVIFLIAMSATAASVEGVQELEVSPSTSSAQSLQPASTDAGQLLQPAAAVGDQLQQTAPSSELQHTIDGSQLQ